VKVAAAAAEGLKNWRMTNTTLRSVFTLSLFESYLQSGDRSTDLTATAAGEMQAQLASERMT
jgi:hypothetical protein